MRLLSATPDMLPTQTLHNTTSVYHRPETLNDQCRAADSLVESRRFDNHRRDAWQRVPSLIGLFIAGSRCTGWSGAG
jgi:hypothetical protein